MVLQMELWTAPQRPRSDVRATRSSFFGFSAVTSPSCLTSACCGANKKQKTVNNGIFWLSVAPLRSLHALQRLKEAAPSNRGVENIAHYGLLGMDIAGLGTKELEQL